MDLERARSFEAEGNKEKALKAYQVLGAWREAARIAWELRRPLEAAELCLRDKLYYEASACFLEARDMERAFNCLLRVPVSHTRYRESCTKAITIALRQGRLDVRLDRFVAPWFHSAPVSPDERNALKELAALYERSGQLEVANTIRMCLPDAQPLRAASGGPLTSPPSTPTPMPLPADESLYSGAEDTLNRRFGAGGGYAGHTAPGAQVPPLLLDVAEASGDDLAIGTVVAERYEILELLGRGAAAVVYRAKDTEVDEAVALKVFGGGASSADSDQRLKREIQILRQLMHENIVRVFDIGRSGRAKFLTMELLQGEDLSTVLARQKQLPPKDAVTIVLQVARGLQHAHERGVVHRDVKPANLFRRSDGVIKIMDFGIAKARGESSRTVAGVFMGTPEYMSPEQITDFANAGPSADLYSCGVLLYELLSGWRPFENNDVMSLLMQQLTEPPPPLSTHGVVVPPQLDTLVMRLLEKRPQDRPNSAAALVAELTGLEPWL